MSQTTDILKSIPFSSRRAVQLAAALAAYFVIAFVLGPFEGLSAQGQCAIATMVAAVIVWVTGALPLAVAAMLMTMIQPLSGAAPLDKALTNFANPIVFFCFGMFCFTFAFTRTGFSERVALWISRLAGGNPARLLLCFIAGGTVLSAFMADVPVVVMLAPVALKVVEQNRCGVMSSNFAKALMIGLPIGVLMGGIATPTGASMNILTMQFLRDMAGVEINYLEWAAIGIPVALVLIPGVWFILLRLFPLEIDSLSDTECLEDAWKELGPMSRDERKFVVFILINVVLWCTDSLHHIPLPVLAVIGGAALFVPGVALIDWEYAAPRMGWDILMLIGGACSLSMSLWSGRLDGGYAARRPSGTAGVAAHAAHRIFRHVDTSAGAQFHGHHRRVHAHGHSSGPEQGHQSRRAGPAAGFPCLRIAGAGHRRGTAGDLSVRVLFHAGLDEGRVNNILHLDTAVRGQRAVCGRSAGDVLKHSAIEDIRGRNPGAPTRGCLQ